MKYKCGKTFWESDNIGFSRNGLWNIPTEIIIDMGATPIDSTCGKCGEVEQIMYEGGEPHGKEIHFNQPKEEKCEYCDISKLPRGTTITVDDNGNCSHCGKKVVLEDKCEEIKKLSGEELLTSTTPFCIVMDKLNELITAFNNHIGGKK